MANITRYTPQFNVLDSLFDELGKGFWLKPVSFPAGTELKMKLEVKEDDKAYTVHAEVPGVKKEDIQVEVHGDQVSIRAEVKQEKEEKEGGKVIHSERSYGMVSRSFSLPTEVDDKATVAKYKDGMLELTLPKRAGGGKRISVQ